MNIETKQSDGVKDRLLKLYLVGNHDYIIKSNTHDLICPFCDTICSTHSFDCAKCGHTMHEICKKLYTDWDIDGHRFYITYKAVDKYPLADQKREVYNAVRTFIVSCLPYSIRNYFTNIIDEVHLSTLVMIYQKSLGIEKAEIEINNDINIGKKVAFKKAIDKSLKNNHEAIKIVWHYYKKYLDYKTGLLKSKTSDFSTQVPLAENENRSIDIKYFEGLYDHFKKKTFKYLNEAYTKDVIVDYLACKKYLVYMSLVNWQPNIKYMRDMITYKLYGDLDLSNDTIYPTINISINDTIEESDCLKEYHEECDHYCEKVYLKIPLLLSDGELIIRTILGTYCDKCKKYFVLDTEFKKILCEGKIQAQISFSESGGHFSGMDLSPESLLRKCGYTVSATSNATKEQRQKLLKAIIDNKLYTPAKIVAHFRFLIAMNNNVSSRDMSSAINKWKEDISFLIQNYS